MNKITSLEDHKKKKLKEQMGSLYWTLEHNHFLREELEKTRRNNTILFWMSITCATSTIILASLLLI